MVFGGGSIEFSKTVIYAAKLKEVDLFRNGYFTVIISGFYGLSTRNYDICERLYSYHYEK